MTYQQYLKIPVDRKIALGFALGPIYIVANVKTEEEAEACRLCPSARYSTKLGWYIPSGTSLPRLHARARFISLDYDEFLAHENELPIYLTKKILTKH